MTIQAEISPLGDSISPERLQRLLSEGVPVKLVDVRTAGEFAEAHIPGAMNVPMDELASRLPDLQSSQPTVIVCQSGRRAGMCHQQIAQVAKSSVLEGGTAAWLANGLPTVGSRNSGLSLMRQVQLVAGVMILTGVLFSEFFSPAWIWLAAFVGAGFTLAGATGFCGMAVLLSKAPWNK